MIRKCLAIGIILLFVGIVVNPIPGAPSNRDDTTPPLTTISFNPPEPNGENGWYVSNVTVILNVSDDFSGVNITLYRIANGSWQPYTEPFVLVDDGKDIFIEFYSVDNAGNKEEIKSAKINIDQTEPEIYLTYEVGDEIPGIGWLITFTATATDVISGMNRLEFYINGEIQETVTGSGPTYVWSYILSSSYPLYGLKVRGLICNPEITDEYVKFYAIIIIISGLYRYIKYVAAYAYDNAGNYDYYDIINSFPSLTVSPGIYLLKNLTLPSDYEGYIGKFFIKATFNV